MAVTVLGGATSGSELPHTGLRFSASDKANGIPVVYFQKGENKEEIARPLINAAGVEGGEDGKGVDRHRPGEGVGVAIVAVQGPGEGQASPHGVGPPNGFRQPPTINQWTL
jgi:hypothetical protein